MNCSTVFYADEIPNGAESRRVGHAIAGVGVSVSGKTTDATVKLERGAIGVPFSGFNK